MSADNWAICPRCLANAEHAAGVADALVQRMYGSVPVEEFDAARAALVPVDPEQCRTFREDYEFYGAEEGRVRAAYSGTCTACGLSCELEYERTFWSPGDSLS